jgi:hypothetical protein
MVDPGAGIHTGMPNGSGLPRKLSRARNDGVGAHRCTRNDSKGFLDRHATARLPAILLVRLILKACWHLCPVFMEK